MTERTLAADVSLSLLRIASSSLTAEASRLTYYAARNILRA